MNFLEVYKKEKEIMMSNYNLDSFYINRELSWIDFNERVLQEVGKAKNPLMERLKFLAITSSNLDEFLMVRFSSVLNRYYESPHSKDISGMTAVDEHEVVLSSIKEFYAKQQHVYEIVKLDLLRYGKTICKIEDLTEDDIDQCKMIFAKKIYPITSPISLDTTKDFPLISSKSSNIVIEILEGNKTILSVIPVHKSLPMYFNIGAEGEEKYVSVEDIYKLNIKKICMNRHIESISAFRIFRENYISVENDEDKLLLERMKRNVKEREQGSPIFMEVSKGIPKHVLKVLLKTIDIPKKHIMKVDTIGLSRLMDSGIEAHEDELYKPFREVYPTDLLNTGNIFKYLDSRDLVLHHPYDSYRPVIDFIESATADSDVIAIRQSLYRVSSMDSPIVNALCRAARNGKYVAVLLELRARFDENQNMQLVEKLRDAGCHITFGVEKLKIHAKFLSIVRREGKSLSIYTHLGTGNYNDKTAKFYTDISYLTSNKSIGEDVITLFNVLSGSSDPKDEIDEIYHSPYNIRYKLHELIDREMLNASKGLEAAIVIKVNSVSDRDIIRKLYQASNNGVKITIISRGVCSMKPINNNIVIKSVIGRFLEHSRIYYFHNNGKHKVFIASADLLTRNLSRRVEIMTPITDYEAKFKVLTILNEYLRNSSDSYYMTKKGKYLCSSDDEAIQDVFINKLQKQRPVIAHKKI